MTLSFLRSSAVALMASAVVLPLIGTGAHADGGHGLPPSALGAPGAAAAVTRTVTITLGDNVYDPDTLAVKAGETVRLVLHNTGDFLHEFNIGTAAMHADHQKEMAMMADHGMLTPTELKPMPGMMHNDPNSVLLKPGETRELIWTFGTARTLEFACNVPGHYESGMVGRIVTSP